MAKFLIEYNPYQSENTTKVSKNGILESPNSKMRSFMNRERLQNWFNKAENWLGLGETIERENNDRTCEITFKGRSIDFEDLEDYFKNHYKSKTQINLKNIPAKNDEDIMAGIERLVDTVEKEGVFEDKKIKELRDTYRRLKNDPFSMSFIATVSSGKSTLFNAILRKDFLPTGDKATTAKIVEIRHTEGTKNFEAECFNENEKLILKKRIVDAEAMKALNANEDIYKIKVDGNIPGIKSDTVNLMLRDTPGPNNSQDRIHEEITKGLIKNDKDMSVVIYIMNATNLEVNSDKELLESMAEAMKAGGKQAKDRVIFVISRCDEWIKTKGQTMESLLEDTRKYLKKNFEIENPNLFPVNALLAKQIWMDHEGYEFDEYEQEDFDFGILRFTKPNPTKTHFEKFATLSSSSRRIVENQLKEAIDSGDDKKIALVHTGVPALEVTINEYLNKYAYPIKISEAVKEFKDIIDDRKMREEFMKLLESSEKAVNDAKEQIENSKKKKDERERKRKEFEERIDKYNLDFKLVEEAKEFAEEKYMDLSDSMLDRLGIKIKVDVAQDAVKIFLKEFNDIGVEVERELYTTIERGIHDEGKRLLEDYGKYMKELVDSIDIKGFDINQVATLKKFDFKNIKEVAKKSAFSEDIIEDQVTIESNPNRHWYTFWRPKNIKVVTPVKTGEVHYISTNDLRSEIVGLSIQVDKYIESVFKNYEYELEKFKVNFKYELGKLDSAIEETLKEISEMICKVECHERNRSYYTEKIERLDEITRKLDEVTSI